MTWVVVPAAGHGSRFGGDLPKQYVLVAGEPLLLHTLRTLLVHPGVSGAVVVLQAGDRHWPGWQRIADKPVMTGSGGATRADSVLAGLSLLPASVRADDFVLVHDAVRPLLRTSDLTALLERGRSDPVGAILAAPVRDTLKRAGADGAIDGTQAREGLWRALTPQLFRRLQLSRALNTVLQSGVDASDEAMAMERFGHRPLLVEAHEDNLKVTTPTDLAYVEFQLSRAQERRLDVPATT